MEFERNFTSVQFYMSLSLMVLWLILLESCYIQIDPANAYSDVMFG